VKPTILGWRCDGCGLWLAAVHYENNAYRKIKDGSPCALGRLINPCQGVMQEIYVDEGRSEGAYGPFNRPEQFPTQEC